ncbi:hypothetical protein ACFL08_00725 [Patescibacteria group bacterium]
MSAIFDERTLQVQQEINQRIVLLINYMGKRWDEALETLNGTRR